MVGLCSGEQLKLQLVALRAAGAYCRGCRPCAAAVGEPLAEACTVPPLAAHQHCTSPPLTSSTALRATLLLHCCVLNKGFSSRVSSGWQRWRGRNCRGCRRRTGQLCTVHCSAAAGLEPLQRVQLQRKHTSHTTLLKFAHMHLDGERRVTFLLLAFQLSY